VNYYLATDTHLGHDKMVTEWGRPKGYEEKFFRRVMATVKKDDILVHLGDLFFGDEASWMGRLLAVKPFKMWLIIGNHDGKSYSWYMTHGFDVACDTMSMTMYGKRILLSHVPMQDFGQYDINVHGHFHDIDQSHHEAEFVAIKNDKHFLLSMEATDYQPLSLKRIVDLHAASLKRPSA
jgi:calcineurin-like phosphoesterase family protein